MNESDLTRVDEMETSRLNGQRVKRLTREMYCSETDPLRVVRDLSGALGTALIMLGGALAMLASALAT